MAGDQGRKATSSTSRVTAAASEIRGRVDFERRIQETVERNIQALEGHLQDHLTRSVDMLNKLVMQTLSQVQYAQAQAHPQPPPIPRHTFTEVQLLELIRLVVLDHSRGFPIDLQIIRRNIEAALRYS